MTSLNLKHVVLSKVLSYRVYLDHVRFVSSIVVYMNYEHVSYKERGRIHGYPSRVRVGRGCI